MARKKRRRKNPNNGDSANDDDRQQAEDIRDFDAGRFRTQRYQPTKTVRLKNRLGKIFSGPIGSFMLSGAKAGVGLETEIDEAAESINWGDAVKTLFENLDDEDPIDVFRDILEDTDVQIEGPNGVYWDALDIDRDFDGYVFELYEVVIWVLRFNYEDMIQKAKKKAIKAGLMKAPGSRKNKSNSGDESESESGMQSIDLPSNG